MDKPTLRKTYLEKRLTLSPDEYESRNQLLLRNLFVDADFSGVGYVHLFLPVLKFKEVNTWLIIDRLRKEYPEVKIVIPKVVGDLLEHFLFENKAQLKTSKWGIEEPAFGERIDPLKLDMVLVPLLVADKKGNRIGYGKGYYDRFLPQCRKDCQLIGLSLLPLLDKLESTESTDFPLNSVVTP